MRGPSKSPQVGPPTVIVGTLAKKLNFPRQIRAFPVVPSGPPFGFFTITDHKLIE